MKNKSPKRKRLEDGNKTTDFQEDKVRMGGMEAVARVEGSLFLEMRILWHSLTDCNIR